MGSEDCKVLIMNYWLCKTEPDVYSWERLVEERETSWDGVRNYQARNFLREMKVGDLVLIYHSGLDKEIRGIARVTKEAYPDPSASEGQWVSVGLRAVQALARPLTLEEIRNTHGLAVMPLVTQARLSVHPVSAAQWEAALKFSKTTLADEHV